MTTFRPLRAGSDGCPRVAESATESAPRCSTPRTLSEATSLSSRISGSRGFADGPASATEPVSSRVHRANQARQSSRHRRVRHDLREGRLREKLCSSPIGPLPETHVRVPPGHSRLPGGRTPPTMDSVAVAKAPDVAPEAVSPSAAATHGSPATVSVAEAEGVGAFAIPSIHLLQQQDRRY